ncbi:probable WRKY transcription factor 70 [Diospyros lotus]|uniref:probable WRKY transcription factor 70 n=1 Tax=Diospyros lotus TaxID=55363 RepID=UPI00224DB11C|nr:probable WRKY transcription factor 70 [Diospyros lotus]
MDFSWLENSSAAAGKAIQELCEGRQLVYKLRSILGREDWADGTGSLAVAKDLAVKISRSFAETISIILDDEHSAADEVSQILANSVQSSPRSDGRKSEDSGESTKRSGVKNLRGCYKRRKTGQTWTMLTPTSNADDYTWRKYGQKSILKAKHPRNYYRCTHKFEKGCQATKQVQQTELDPPMYMSTYHGQHTCRNTRIQKSPIVVGPTDLEDNTSFLISFGSASPNREPPGLYFPAISFGKQEENYKEKKPSWDSYNINGGEIITPEMNSPADNGDVISSRAENTCNGEGFGLDSTVDGFGFDDAFDFEFE